MNVTHLEILLRLYVLLVEITFVYISMNFETQYGNISKEAGWTLTPTPFSHSGQQRLAGLIHGPASESGHWAVRAVGVVSAEAS